MMRERVYLESSAWNHLLDHSRRDEIVSRLRECTAQASVLSAGEILLTLNEERRSRLAALVLTVHPDEFPILDRPFAMARKAAQAWLCGETTVEFGESPEAFAIFRALSDFRAIKPTALRAWLHEYDRGFEAFLSDVRPAIPLDGLSLCDPLVLDAVPLLDGLRGLAPVRDLGLSQDQMRELCAHSDVWRALRASVVAGIVLSFSHSPKWRRGGGRRPSGRDLQHAVYLGVSTVFVTDDGGLREVLTEIAGIFGDRRRVLDFPSLIESIFDS